jgi:hypothetical protein
MGAKRDGPSADEPGDRIGDLAAQLTKRKLITRVIRAQVTAVKLCGALTTANRQSTEHRHIGAASLPRRAEGSRRRSAGPRLVGEKPRRRAQFVTVTICSLPAVRHLAGHADG